MEREISRNLVQEISVSIKAAGFPALYLLKNTLV